MTSAPAGRPGARGGRDRALRRRAESAGKRGRPGRHRQLRRAARRHPLGHRLGARHPRRLAGPVRRQPRGDRPRPGPHPPRHRAGLARRRERRLATRSVPATPCRASPPPSAPPAAGRPCTRPTGGRSAPTRTRSAPEPCSPSRTRRRRHRTLHARRRRRQGHRHQRGRRRRPRQRLLAPAPAPSGGHQQPRLAHRPAQAKPSATAGLPRWLEIVLVAAGLLIATAFLTEPVLTIARRRRAARLAAADAHIVLADYKRLVVTHSRQDGTVYVLRPPDADPHAILLAARLVLAQDRYEQLAGHLGVPAHWPQSDPGDPGRPRGRPAAAALTGPPAGRTGSGGTPPARLRADGPRPRARRCWRSAAPAPDRQGRRARPSAGSS